MNEIASSAGEVRGAFVDWVAHCSRSENLASRLGMRLIRHHRPAGGPLSRLGKYTLQFLRTWRDLWRQRPAAVVCMNPPPLAAIPVWLYALKTRVPWMMDAHTGAFLGEPWERLAFLSRFLCRRATRTLVTNEHLQQLVEHAGGRPLLLPDVPTELAPPFRASLPSGFNAAFVCSWAPDEPVQIVLDAARELSDMEFHITGKPTARGDALVGSRPPNVHLTGFLSRDGYLALIGTVDVVIALTTRNHTMQRSAYEAIYLGTPVIASDWPVLRENFAAGGIMTENSSQGLIGALREARARIEALRDAARSLRSEKLARWEGNERALRAILDATS